MPTITFLSPRLAREWAEKAPAKLRDIILWIAMEAWPQENHIPTPPLVITCILRTPEENAALKANPRSPHLAGLAVDVRNRDLNDRQKLDIVQRVNARWVYDPTRPEMKVCLLDDNGVAHFHVQIHERTVLR